MNHVSLTFSSIFLIGVCNGKIFSRCELAKDLVDNHKISKQQVATWVCIAEHESQLNTSAVGSSNGDGSQDHGIFQISDIYWCSPPGNGWACGVTCAELEDDDISDDISCAKRIYREHKQLSGDGFNAWAVYQPFCHGSTVKKYIQGCFDDGENDQRGLANFLMRFQIDNSPKKEDQLDDNSKNDGQLNESSNKEGQLDDSSKKDGQLNENSKKEGQLLGKLDNDILRRAFWFR